MSDDTLLGKITSTIGDAAESLGEQVTRSGGAKEDFSEDGQYLLPTDLKDALAQSMDDLGFPLEPAPGRLRDFSSKWHRFYKARVKDGYLAFLYVRNRLLESGIHGNDFAWIGMLFAQSGAKGLFIFSDSSRVEPVYDTQAESWQETFGFQRAHFFHHGYETQLISSDPESRKNDLADWLKLARYTPSAQPPGPTISFEDLKEDQAKRERIVSIIANAAAHSPGITPAVFIQDLINRTSWPQIWKTRLAGLWAGNTDATARALVDFALSRKINTDNQFYTTIGGLLEMLIRSDTDLEDGKFLFKLIQDHALIMDKAAVQKIQDECFHSN